MNLKTRILTGLIPINRFFIKKILTAVSAAVLASALLIVHVPGSSARSDANLSLLQPGMPLPELLIHHAFTPEQRHYLGLSTGFMGMFAPKQFTPADVSADVLVIEFFNAYCPTCQRQAPIMNEVFGRVNAVAGMRERVRFFGIGAGNIQREAEMFERRYAVPFPMFADPDFENYEAIGSPGATPLTIIVKQAGRELRIVSAHVGLIKDQDVLVREIRKALRVDFKELVPAAAEQSPDETPSARLDLPMSGKALQKKVLESMRNATSGDVAFKKVVRRTYPRSGEIFVATPEDEAYNPKIYAQVVSRAPTCDVCHGVHFILVFDAEGFIRYFEPLHLTKYGNVEWSTFNVDFMRRKIVGLSFLHPVEYDPSYDAVSTATMTSVIIFNSVQRLKRVLDEINGK